MKDYILVFFTVFISGFLIAQEKMDIEEKTALTLGAKAGLNISDFENGEQAKSLVGFHAGFFGEFDFKNNFSLQPELLFSTQGAKFEDGNVNLQYCSLPLMAKYFVVPSFYIETGPQLSFLLSAKKRGVDVRDSFKTTDVSLDFGLGYIVSDKISLGLRYNLGIMRLQESIETKDQAIKNSVFQIALGYVFY